jgi:hypothetical protein
MEKEVVNFFHQFVEIAVWLVAHPRKHVVDRLFETVFKLCSEALDSEPSRRRL